MNRDIVRLILAEQLRLLILLATLGTGCLLLWFYLLGPQHHQLTARQADWTAKRRSAIMTAGTHSPNRATLEKLWAALPERHELPRILGQLYDMAGMQEVAITALSYKPQATSVEGLIAYTLRCTASGRYAALKRFLAELHQLHGIGTVDSVSFSNSDPLQERISLETQITVHLRSGATP